MSKSNYKITNIRRKLQFEGMFESGGEIKPRKKRDKVQKRIGRSQALANSVEEVVMNSDRYNLWWKGPPEDNKFIAAEWSASHRSNSNAVFTMAVIQGLHDKIICKTPNDLILFLGSLRRVFDGDVVMAIESSSLTSQVISILKYYQVIVYILPENLCSRSTRSIFF